MEASLTEILSIFWKIAPGLIGVFIGRYWTKRKDRVALTLDFFKELSSESFSKRVTAIAEFRHKNPGKWTADQLWEKFKFEEKELLYSILVIEGFYTRLCASVKLGHVDKKMVKSLFARDFFRLYFRFFEALNYSEDDRDLDLYDHSMRDLADWYAQNLPKKRYEAYQRIYNS